MIWCFQTWAGMGLYLVIDSLRAATLYVSIAPKRVQLSDPRWHLRHSWANWSRIVCARSDPQQNWPPQLRLSWIPSAARMASVTSLWLQMVSCNTAFENNLQAQDLLPEFCMSWRLLYFRRFRVRRIMDRLKWYCRAIVFYSFRIQTWWIKTDAQRLKPGAFFQILNTSIYQLIAGV